MCFPLNCFCDFCKNLFTRGRAQEARPQFCRSESSTDGEKGNRHYINFSLNMNPGILFSQGNASTWEMHLLASFCRVLDEKMNAAVMALHYTQSRSFSGRLQTEGND